MTDLERAKAALKEGVTLALVCGEREKTSRERGIRPLLRILAAGEDFGGGSAADLVVGRAAAFLYRLIGVKEVFADVMSEGAERLFEQYGILSSCRTRTAYIVNRVGTGPCPMEAAVAEISDPAEAYAALREKVASMGAPERKE